MAVVPLTTSETESESSSDFRRSGSIYWARVAGAASLAASGVLLMAGKRRAGMVVAVAGTALTLIDQQDTVSDWWNRMPGYLEEVQSILSRVQGAVDELSAQGERPAQRLVALMASSRLA